MVWVLGLASSPAFVPRGSTKSRISRAISKSTFMVTLSMNNSSNQNEEDAY